MDKLKEKSLNVLYKIQELPIGTIFTAKDLGMGNIGACLTSLVKHDFLNKENNKSPYKYSYTGKVYIPLIIEKISSNNGYTSHTRANNQYFAEYMENAICDVINKVPIINHTDFPFTDKDMELMNKQAQHWVEVEFPYATKADYVGRNTITGDCDIIINDTEHVELKYVSKGYGTYLNTSIYYFERFNFNFHDYMEKFKYLDFLKEFLGDKVKYKDKSPVSREVSSDFRENHKDIYRDKILPTEKIMRQAFVNDLIKYFTQPEHYDDLQLFGHQMLTKETLTSRKSNPDFVSVYGYEDDKIRRVYPTEILKPNEPIIVTQEEELNRTKETVFFIKLNHVLRIQIGWQNGTGLNNPTIRVFIDKEKGIK